MPCLTHLIIDGTNEINPNFVSLIPFSCCISRQDYVELLQYAQERNVKILPEVSFRLQHNHSQIKLIFPVIDSHDVVSVFLYQWWSSICQPMRVQLSSQWKREPKMEMIPTDWLTQRYVGDFHFQQSHHNNWCWPLRCQTVTRTPNPHNNKGWDFPGELWYLVIPHEQTFSSQLWLNSCLQLTLTSAFVLCSGEICSAHNSVLW